MKSEFVIRRGKGAINQTAKVNRIAAIRGAETRNTSG